jgi:signal peptidase I
LSSKKVSALTIALGLSLVGAVALHILINPELIYGTDNVQVIKVASSAMEPTINAGNYVLVDKQVNSSDLSVNYPNSDIIVFYQPGDPADLIVHRIVAVDEIDGTLYFRTKGDGNSPVKWPNTPSTSEYDPWQTDGVPGVREDLVVGKVVDNNYPITYFTLGFWLMAAISIAAGTALVALYISNSLKKRQSHMRELEERVRGLEAEKKDKILR